MITDTDKIISAYQNIYGEIYTEKFYIYGAHVTFLNLAKYLVAVVAVHAENF